MSGSGLKYIIPNHKRLKAFSIWSVPKTMKAADIEKAVHKRLKPYRLEGEWFNLSVVQANQAIEGIDGFILQLNTLQENHPWANLTLAQLLERGRKLNKQAKQRAGTDG